MNFVKANFKYIRKEKFDYTQTEIAKFLGIDRGNVSSYEDGRAKVPIEVMLKLVDVYNNEFSPKITLDILVKHDMSQGDLFDTNIYAGNTQPGPADLQGKNLDIRTLAITTDDTGKKNIEYVAIEAHAGYTNGYGDLDYISELPKFRLPFLPLDGTYRAFKIKGDSMNPLPSGSVVIGENVRDWKTLKSGDTYVIITRNDGIVYKRVTNLLQQGESVLLLNSDNPDYDSYTINASEIVEVWKARTFIIDNPYP